MGINLEYITLLEELKAEGLLRGGTVLEFGAQDISAPKNLMAKHFQKFNSARAEQKSIDTAGQLYALYGYMPYQAIDASGEYGAHVYDLNRDLRREYGFDTQFDLVTNLGTIEHCFNPAQALENMHNLCRAGGLMIHQFPSTGNANHGFYNMQPRLFKLIAMANGYEIPRFAFSVDYKPILRSFSHDAYAACDDRDLLCYAVFRKTGDAPFQHPFDSMFDDKRQLQDYKAAIPSAEFRSYIKGSWKSVTPSTLSGVPLRIEPSVPLLRRFFKKAVNIIGRYI